MARRSLQVMRACGQAVEQALAEAGYRTASVNLDDDFDRLVAAVVVEAPDLVFSLVDEFYADNTQHAAVMATLDLLGIPYTGADPLCLATCQDRVRTHLMLRDAGVPVPAFGVVRDINAVPDTSAFRFPVIVTQAFDDLYEEEGLERPIYSRVALEDRVAQLSKEFELPLLVEEYLEYRRLHAVVIGGRLLEVLPLVEMYYGEEEAAAPVSPEEAVQAEMNEGADVEEVEHADDAAEAPDDAAPVTDEEVAAEDAGDHDEAEIVETEEAWSAEEPTRPEGLALAQLDLATADRIRQLSRTAFRVLGCRDCAVIDFHLDDAGEPYVVDVRPVVDMTPGGVFHVAAEATEGGFAGAIADVARAAARRHKLLAEPTVPVLGVEPVALAEPPAEEPPAPGELPADAPAAATVDAAETTPQELTDTETRASPASREA